MAFSGSQRTRLGLYGGTRHPYGAFAGKISDAVAITFVRATVYVAAAMQEPVHVVALVQNDSHVTHSRQNEVHVAAAVKHESHVVHSRKNEVTS